jgi:Na+-translocating ferredoxin:NAD+ oxidoreductase subunit D
MPEAPSYLLSSSPHVFAGANVRRLMLNVILALLPATAWGIYLFGLPALLLVAVTVVSSLVFETAFRLLLRSEAHWGDLSAVVSGLLLALILPPSTPLWMAALGALAAVVLAKEFFGGLGHNPFNPALIGRAILLMSFPAAITTWHKPFQVLADAATTATPLNIIKQGGSLADVAKSIGASNHSEVYATLFIGNRSGCIGESSILLLLAGAVFLLLTRTIDFRAPLAILLATALTSLAFGADPLFAVLSGGVVFGAFFMATDYVSAPITPAGKLVFGALIGVILVLIRQLGGFPEGVTYAILIMNAFTPHLNKLIPKKYGWVKPARQGGKAK